MSECTTMFVFSINFSIIVCSLLSFQSIMHINYIYFDLIVIKEQILVIENTMLVSFDIKSIR